MGGGGLLFNPSNTVTTPRHILVIICLLRLYPPPELQRARTDRARTPSCVYATVCATPGQLPSFSWSQLTALEFLDVSNNQFRGTVPLCYSTLSHLRLSAAAPANCSVPQLSFGSSPPTIPPTPRRPVRPSPCRPPPAVPPAAGPRLPGGPVAHPVAARGEWHAVAGRGAR